MFDRSNRFEKLWHKLTTPSADLERIEDQQRARLIAAFLVTVQPIAPMAVLVAYFLIPADGAPFHIIVPLMLISNLLGLVAYGLSRTRYYYVGAALLVFAASSAIFLAAYIGNAPKDAVFSLFYMIVPILLGGVFLSSRMTTLIATLHIAAILLLPILNSSATLSDIGQPIFFNLILSPLVILIFHHRTQIERQRVTTIEVEKHKADLLAVELEKERELDALQNQFMALASHQFRTPLAVIHTSAEIMLRYPDRLSTDRRQQHLQNILNQTDRTNGLVDNTLILTHIATGQLAPCPGWLNPHYFGQEIVRAMQPEPPRISYTCTNGAESVYLDAEFIKAIVRSVLENALKYSIGPIEFDLQCGSETLKINVRDQGIGILDDDQPLVFEPFHRGGNVGENVAGAGLGLTIARAHVDLLGGRIDISSVVDEGTTVAIEIPFMTVADAKAPVSTDLHPVATP